MVDWDYFDRFEVCEFKDEGGYLPDEGDGDNQAEQCVTAVNRLIYEWYNNGGVFDNNYAVRDSCNDESGCANWLARYAPGADAILSRIRTIRNSDEYESRILKPLADLCLNISYLRRLEKLPKVDSVYSCKGPYNLREYFDDEDDEDDDYSYDRKSKLKLKPLIKLKRRGKR